jgi:hypothetical protein
MIRNRIKCHRRVRAGDLVPHELNYRAHPDRQRHALEAIYDEVGFARSLLAYELPGGRLKLIDGHLRRDIDPNMEVDVEVLDVNDAEARALLLTIDPLAQLAETQTQIHERLLELTPTISPDLQAAWQAAAAACANKPPPEELRSASLGPPQFLVMIKCADEKQQVDLLDRLAAEGLDCRALVG